MKSIDLDNLVYGNPTLRDHNMMLKESYLDKLLPKLQNFTPPRNSSNAAQSEIRQLMSYVAQKRDQKNNLYDEALLDVIKQHFLDVGASEEFVTTVTNGIAEDVIPMIVKLKYFFNRPRPQQLSYYYGFNFFPDFSFFTASPSFPSAHTCLTAITCEVLGNLYPENYKHIMNVLAEARASRLYLGVHYPSDNDMAMVVAKEVLNNPEFKMKYRL